MGKKNKKNKKAREINDNEKLENDNKLDNELDEVLREIEVSTQRVKGTLINKQVTQKISSLRAISGNNNELSNNSLLDNIKSREVGGKLQTQCTACRRRLFG